MNKQMGSQFNLKQRYPENYKFDSPSKFRTLIKISDISLHYWIQVKNFPQKLRFSLLLCDLLGGEN